MPVEVLVETPVVFDVPVVSVVLVEEVPVASLAEDVSAKALPSRLSEDCLM